MPPPKTGTDRPPGYSSRSVFFFFALLTPDITLAADHSLFGALLKNHVNDGARIHFAINCASKSCPPLQSTPYSGETPDSQPDAATRAFINDTRFNYLDGNGLFISRIFKWCKKEPAS